MTVIEKFVIGPEACGYLSDRKWTLRYQYLADISPTEYERCMDEGWRKFGRLMFRPSCAACQECRTIRIRANEFMPNRSQRRAWLRNQDLTVRYGLPKADAHHTKLYQNYHQYQTLTKGWPEHSGGIEDYAFAFVENPLPAIEIAAWLGDRLVAVALTDITPNTLSAVYHYYEPTFRQRSLGTFIILHVIALARRLGKHYVYLGYLVNGCANLTYKASFRPHDVLHLPPASDPDLLLGVGTNK